MIWSDMAHHCAPQVETMQQVIPVESGGDPLAIRVNGLRHQPPRARTPAEAVAVAKRFIAAGYKVDLGYSQLDSENLPMLGETVEQQFDGSCTNIRAGAAILAAAYERALKMAPAGQLALRVALSIYNTGSPVRGFVNGYVDRYYHKAASLPALQLKFVAQPPKIVPRNKGPVVQIAGWYLQGDPYQ